MKEKVEALIKTLENDNTGVEAVALFQNGEMVIEHHFTPSPPRCIYSHTKSYTATAVGIAIDEGKLNLSDRVVDLFPEYESEVTDENMRKVELRHLLMMASGVGDALLMGDNRKRGEGYPDYVRYFLSRKLKYAPGEKFVYSNADTHMAGCMVERAVGDKLQRYVYEKIFKKLDMGFPAWETDPSGTAFGASGLYLTISEMMKLGILYLNGGVWNGERIVSSEWISEAGKKQISTGSRKAWDPGYGYQFWMMPKENSFRADGAFGQLSIVIPDKNAVLATQCSEYNNVNKFISLILDTCE